MRLAILTHAEAADAAVIANLARHLMGDASTAYISHADRPDVGLLPAPVVALPAPLLVPEPPSALNPIQAAFAPSSAAVGAATIAPAAVIPPIPSTALAPAAVPAPPVPVPPVIADQQNPANAAPPAAVDSAGFPWDERIHASSKATISDGTWRQKRGVDAGVLAAVTAELIAKHGIAVRTPAPAPAVAPIPPVVPNSAFAAGALAAAEAGQQPPVAPNTFSALMLWVTPYMTKGLLTNAGLQEVLNVYGVSKLPDLITQPTLVPMVYEHLVAQFTEAGVL